MENQVKELATDVLSSYNSYLIRTLYNSIIKANNKHEKRAYNAVIEFIRMENKSILKNKQEKENLDDKN